MTRSAFASGDIATLSGQLLDQLADARREAALVVFFGHIKEDGKAIGDALRKFFGNAPVIGCSANGVFSDHGHGQSGCSAIVLEHGAVTRVATALARIGQGVDDAVAGAVREMSSQLGKPLRDLEYDNHVGLALLEGATTQEERVNEALGNAAPGLRVVGGSAGDDTKFEGTWTYHNGVLAEDGCALATLEMAAPFGVIQACSFRSTGRSVQVTRVDPGTRILREIDGKSAAAFYAELAGKPAEELEQADYFMRPLGLMIDGKPWLRSAVRTEGDGVLFACQVVEGSTLDLMQPGDLIADTRSQLAELRDELGGKADGMVLFNCAYRMVEAQVLGKEAEYHAMLSEYAHAGFHTNGESYLGHINQTLTGLAFRSGA